MDILREKKNLIEDAIDGIIQGRSHGALFAKNGDVDGSSVIRCTCKETRSERFEDIQYVLTAVVKASGNTCPDEDITLVATLFENHTEGIPEYEGIQRDGQVSYGFYYLYLKLTMYDADPKVFFQILKVDTKIGWTNQAHVEKMVFGFKKVKIIEDEKVRNRSEHFFFQKNNLNFRIGLNGAALRISVYVTF